MLPGYATNGTGAYHTWPSGYTPHPNNAPCLAVSGSAEPVFFANANADSTVGQIATTTLYEHGFVQVSSNRPPPGSSARLPGEELSEQAVRWSAEQPRACEFLCRCSIYYSNHKNFPPPADIQETAHPSYPNEGTRIMGPQSAQALTETTSGPPTAEGLDHRRYSQRIVDTYNCQESYYASEAVHGIHHGGIMTGLGTASQASSFTPSSANSQGELLILVR